MNMTDVTTFDVNCSFMFTKLSTGILFKMQLNITTFVDVEGGNRENVML